MKSLALLLLGVLPLIALAQQSPVISKTQLDLSTDIQYVGGNYVYGLAPNGTVYQSTNQGKSYQLLPGIDNILSIYQGQKDGLVFLLGGWPKNTSYWIDGTTITKVNLGNSFEFNQVLLHPKDQTQMLASHKRGGESSFELFLITGATSPNPTVRMVRDKVYNYYHCFAGFDKISPGRICAISDVPRSGPQRLVISEDSGNTWVTRIDALITTYTEHWSFIFAVDAESRLWVSSDNATSFKAAVFPEDARIYRIDSNQILSARPGAVFIGGYPGVDDWGTPRDGSIYASDATGLEYTLVGDHINSLNNWWDFATVHELEGFYFTNFLLGWENDRYVGPNGEVRMKTALTDNNAAKWSFIRAPPGSNCDVNDPYDCSLNLFGRTTWLGVGGGFYSDVYSTWNSVGYVIGTGNVGPYLNTTGDYIKTFISYDGGYNWTTLFDFPTISSYNPNSGIMVFARNQVPIKSFYYSIDGGVNREEVVLDGGNEHICISLNNPDWERTFVLKCQGPTYFVIDFATQNINACKTGPNEDIEPFTPDNKACILGRTTVYQRRKLGAQCSLPTGFASITSATNCPCNESDYECDMGYARSYREGTCRLVDPGQYDPTQNTQLCTGNTYYSVSKGYRKISGDTCVKDLSQYQPEQKMCSYSSIIFPEGGMSKGGVVALMLFFMLIVGIGAFVGGIIAGHKSHHIRERVPKSWVSVESHRLI